MTQIATLIKATGLTEREAAKWFGIGHDNLRRAIKGKSNTSDDLLRDVLILAKIKLAKLVLEVNTIESELKARE